MLHEGSGYLGCEVAAATWCRTGRYAATIEPAVYQYKLSNYSGISNTTRHHAPPMPLSTPSDLPPRTRRRSTRPPPARSAISSARTANGSSPQAVGLPPGPAPPHARLAARGSRAAVRRESDLVHVDRARPPRIRFRRRARAHRRRAATARGPSGRICSSWPPSAIRPNPTRPPPTRPPHCSQPCNS